MSKQIGNLYHPVNKNPVEIYEGFSWPCLFLGCFWYLYKGMGLWTLIAFLAALLTSGILWLIFPFFANKQHVDHLFKQGYLAEASIKRPKKSLKTNSTVSLKSEKKFDDSVKQLKKLSELKEKGFVTEEEFEYLKKDILNKM